MRGVKILDIHVFIFLLHQTVRVSAYGKRAPKMDHLDPVHVDCEQLIVCGLRNLVPDCKSFERRLKCWLLS